jgi:hypothetical protein
VFPEPPIRSEPGARFSRDQDGQIDGWLMAGFTKTTSL